jgi:hypothetical protein
MVPLWIVIAVAVVGACVSVIAYQAGRTRQLNLDIPRMRPLCDDLRSFVNGEMDPRIADRFRNHLAYCYECRKELKEQMLLVTHLEELGLDRDMKPMAGDL